MLHSQGRQGLQEAIMVEQMHQVQEEEAGGAPKSSRLLRTDQLYIGNALHSEN